MIPSPGEDTAAAPVQFSFALQPIIDTDTSTIFSYEAFVRGIHGEPAHSVVRHIDRISKPVFDSLVCERSIGLAAQLGLKRHLSVNLFGGTARCSEQRIEAILQAASRHAFPTQRLVVELSDAELAENHRDFGGILRSYRKLGLRTAIDFVSTQPRYLSMLVECQPAFIKLDRRLCAGIEYNSAHRSIVKTLARLSEQTDIALIAGGVETREEFEALRDQGITLFQGYYFARPEFELLPAVPLARLLRGCASPQHSTDGFAPWAAPLVTPQRLH